MGLGIVRRRTKLTEGSHRGLHSSGLYADMLLLLLFFTFFTFFFQNPKSRESRDFLRFFAVSHTFTRTTYIRVIRASCSVLNCSALIRFRYALRMSTHSGLISVVLKCDLYGPF